MKIRQMQARDIPAIAELEKQTFSAPWSENTIRSSFDNKISCWLVAEVEGVVVGYVGSESVLDSADMMNVAVSPNYRRQGIAEALINALSDALRAKDIRFLMLEVRVSNMPAIALYEKLGFTVAGRRPRYYCNPREDAYVMRKELKP